MFVNGRLSSTMILYEGGCLIFLTKAARHEDLLKKLIFDSMMLSSLKFIADSKMQ